MPCANASIMRFLKREPRGCAAITCSRCSSVNAEYARPRTSISTPAITSATPPAEKVSRGIGAVDLEPLGLAAVIVHEPHFVNHRTDLQQLGIQLEPFAHA